MADLSGSVDTKQEPMLAVRDIRKSFGTNDVLKGVDLEVAAGEVVALIGGNGAGKSTLVKIIMGIYSSDSGSVSIRGQKYTLNRPSAALAMGIYLVPQEPLIFPNMSVEENIVIGFRERRRVLLKRINEILLGLGWDLDLSRKGDSLSIAEQQLVEIVRGLLRNSQVLIFDEPTSALTFREVESFFKIIADLKERGLAIIYITHRLNEVFEIATQVLIMRDGMISLKGPVGNFTREMLVQGLMPDDVMAQEGNAAVSDETVKCVDPNICEPTLITESLYGYGFEDISFSLYPGEILGLAGVVGAGRTELATSIFGKDTIKSGSVKLNGEDVTGLSTAQLLRKGITYVPEDRFLNGIFSISSVAANITSEVFVRGRKLLMNYRKERAVADEAIKEFRIKVTDRDQEMRSISGGNQQKAIIARALTTEPKVVILDEPTRGIDAAARSDVYASINMLKEKGVAVLLISSDIEEIVSLSDRAIVMYQGRILSEFAKSSITQDNITAASFGIVSKEKALA